MAVPTIPHGTAKPGDQTLGPRPYDPGRSVASRRVARRVATGFMSYNIRMVSEEQIQSWADEAEAGYDVQELKHRGRGRPGRGAEPMQVVAVRLTAEEVAALDQVAEREHVSRSEAIRRALADFAA